MEQPFLLFMAPTLPPPAPESEAQALRAEATKLRLMALQCEKSAKALDLAAARLEGADKNDAV